MSLDSRRPGSAGWGQVLNVQFIHGLTPASAAAREQSPRVGMSLRKTGLSRASQRPLSQRPPLTDRADQEHLSTVLLRTYPLAATESGQESDKPGSSRRGPTARRR